MDLLINKKFNRNLLVPKDLEKLPQNNLIGSILFVIGDKPNIFFCHLGHEIGGAKPFIFDLLCKNIINTKNTTILTLKDRTFLYEHIFNTLAHEDDVIDYKNYDNIINLSEMCKNPHLGHGLEGYHYGAKWEKEEFFHYITNNLFKNIYIPRGFNNYKDADWINYMCSCNVEKYDIFDSDFIILHYRNYNPSEHNRVKCWNYESNEKINNLYNILLYIKSYTRIKNVLLFGNLKQSIVYEDLNIKQTTNLKNYVSYLKSDKCKLLISGLSGAQQLANRFFNKISIVYGIGNDQIKVLTDMTKNKDILYNKYLIPNTSWDFLTVSNIKIYYYPSIKDVLYLFKTLSDKIIDFDTIDQSYNEFLQSNNDNYLLN